MDRNSQRTGPTTKGTQIHRTEICYRSADKNLIVLVRYVANITSSEGSGGKKEGTFSLVSYLTMAAEAFMFSKVQVDQIALGDFSICFTKYLRQEVDEKNHLKLLQRLDVRWRMRQ